MTPEEILQVHQHNMLVALGAPDAHLVPGSPVPPPPAPADPAAEAEAALAAELTAMYAQGWREVPPPSGA